MDAQDVAAKLWDAADGDGQIDRDDLPAEVRERMQWVADHRLWECQHITATSDLPASLVPKVAVSGVPLVAYAQPTCVFDLFHRLAVWRLPIDETCIFCRRRDAIDRTSFRDRAAEMTMTAFVCVGCASPGGRLASWAGVPDV